MLEGEKKKAFTEYDRFLISRLQSDRKQKYNIGNKIFFPEWYIDRLFNMGYFTRTVMKQNDEVVQIGDNDSGRLIKLTPSGNGDKDNVINHSGLLSAMGGLFQEDVFDRYTERFPLVASLIHALAGGFSLKGKKYEQKICCENNQKYDLRNYAYFEETILFEDYGTEDLLAGLSVQYFEKFGLLIFRSRRIFLSIVIDTKYITRDPGGYVYTAAPEIRNVFRGTRAHNTICVKGIEQNRFSGIFGMKKGAKAFLLECTGEKIVVREKYAGIDHIREILFTETKIKVKDYVNKPFSVDFQNAYYSTGYGKMRGKINYDSEQI